MLGRQRRFDPLLGVGIALSLVVHGGLAVAIVYERGGPSAPPAPPPREFVAARLARLGTKRPPGFLPVIPPRQTAGPKRGLRLSQNADAEPSKRKEEQVKAELEAQAIRRADSLAKVFAEAQKEADQEGDPQGSPLGTALEATPGDEYATACAEAVQKVWTVPPETLLPDEVLSRLSAQVRVVIDQRGKVLQATITQPSQNKYFDASLEDALGRLRALPQPPKTLVGDHPKVGILLMFEGKNVGR